MTAAHAESLAPAIVKFRVRGRPISRWAMVEAEARGRYLRYRGRVAAHARRAMGVREPVDSPVVVQIVHRVRPAAMAHDARLPDLDNITKGVIDALREIVIDDDDQVRGLFVWRAEASGPECVEVTVVPWLGATGGSS